MAETPRDAATPAMSGDSLARTIAIAKQELEQMMDLNPQGMLLIDGSGTIVRANRAIVDLTEVAGFDDLLGHRLASIFVTGDTEFFVAMLASEGGTESFDTHLTLPDGLVREFSFTVLGAGGSDEVRVIMVADITGAKARVADQERIHKKEAVAALIGGLMHHINQPLTVITVTAKLMEMGLERPAPDVGELRKYLSTISEGVMRVKTMLENVEAASDYVTEEYLEGKRILDINHLGRTEGLGESHD
ncbi:MAG: PAS domain-containing protein [Verrucomicrobia bacterium]|jgi:nitrogen-specific signal transduction histidine kinase|nr:PAS domain-containing protein [Verrucomicrobiota bacterium]MBT7067082.1 PAS domain-containing protein [Verrucomicrobiota bacterium]MBT7700619.1 PAS domain-containing protein [Verrucomicrobiota bacterium]